MGWPYTRSNLVLVQSVASELTVEDCLVSNIDSTGPRLSMSSSVCCSVSI